MGHTYRQRLRTLTSDGSQRDAYPHAATTCRQSETGISVGATRRCVWGSHGGRILPRGIQPCAACLIPRRVSDGEWPHYGVCSLIVSPGIVAPFCCVSDDKSNVMDTPGLSPNSSGSHARSNILRSA